MRSERYRAKSVFRILAARKLKRERPPLLIGRFFRRLLQFLHGHNADKALPTEALAIQVTA